MEHSNYVGAAALAAGWLIMTASVAFKHFRKYGASCNFAEKVGAAVRDKDNDLEEEEDEQMENITDSKVPRLNLLKASTIHVYKAKGKDEREVLNQ